MKQPVQAVWKRDGRRAIRELLALTVSELEASRLFRTDVDVGPLPVAEPHKKTDSGLAALARGRETQKQEREQWNQKRAARISL